MRNDNSAGWEAVADRFMAIRSNIGTPLVRSWARHNLVPSASIIDIGCGSGILIAQALADDGYAVFGCDGSPSLVTAFRHNLPNSPVSCEAAQDSNFFGRSFAGAVSIGLMFLLDADDQHRLLGKVGDALAPGGRFLFSAPRETCERRDTLTGRTSISLGEDAYKRHLTDLGLRLVDCQTDEGGNNYHDVAKDVQAPTLDPLCTTQSETSRPMKVK